MLNLKRTFQIYNRILKRETISHDKAFINPSINRRDIKWTTNANMEQTTMLIDPLTTGNTIQFSWKLDLRFRISGKSWRTVWYVLVLVCRPWTIVSMHDDTHPCVCENTWNKMSDRQFKKFCYVNVIMLQ